MPVPGEPWQSPTKPLAVELPCLRCQTARVPGKRRVQADSDPAYPPDRDDLLCCLDPKVLHIRALGSGEYDGCLDRAGRVDAQGVHESQINYGDADFRVKHASERDHHCGRVWQGSSRRYIGRVCERGRGGQAQSRQPLPPEQGGQVHDEDTDAD